MCASTSGRWTAIRRSRPRAVREGSCTSDAVIGAVPVHDIPGRAVEDESALAEVETARAEAQQIALVVRHEEEGAAAGEQLLDARVALVAERLVAHGEHLVDEDD